jgi:hypothetical protein
LRAGRRKRSSSVERSSGKALAAVVALKLQPKTWRKTEVAAKPDRSRHLLCHWAAVTKLMATELLQQHQGMQQADRSIGLLIVLHHRN